MNEVEEKFLEETVKPIFDDYKKEIMKKLLGNKDKFKKQVLNVLRNIADKANKIENYKVKYIDFSLLQIQFLRETYEVTAIAYDENWYAGEGIWEVFSIDYIFEELKEIKSKLYKDIKKYVGKIRPFCIEQYILKQIPIFNNFFTYFLINWLKQWDEEESFKEMPKTNVIQITWGEYKNNLQKVFSYEFSIKTEDMFKKMIEGNKPEDMIFSTWTGLQASNIIIEDNDISCMSLKESNLKNLYLFNCIGVGLNFKKANLKKCHFKNCDLGASDFTESILEEVIFENCILRNMNFKGAQFKNVYLRSGSRQKSILKEEDLLYLI